MNLEDKKKIIDILKVEFVQAGQLSLDLRKKGLKETIKSDNTPVTNGDLEVNKIVTSKIKELTSEIPIVSEESSMNKDNESLKNFWLIDPIDGTYDYIHNKDEFTLNAGLIINKEAYAGIIYAPAKNRMFYTFGDKSSYEIKNDHELLINKKKIDKKNIKAVSYSNKIKPEIEKIHKKLNVKEHTKMKSSLKFCVVATGEFQVYVAEPRAYEWDIAAGHAILKNSGGTVTDFDGNNILYGKRGFKNPSIILRSLESI